MAEALDPAQIAFRPLREKDIARVYRWRCLPHVLEWWHGDTYEAIEAKLTRRIRGEAPVACFLILYSGAPIGYIQTFRLRDFPEYASRVGESGEEAAGVDLFIGEEGYLHRGLGALILRAFLREIVFADPTVASCLIDPEPDNTIAIRAYAKAGFRYLKTIEGEQPEERAYLMRLARAEVERPPVMAG